jgi:hypothetical protein
MSATSRSRSTPLCLTALLCRYLNARNTFAELLAYGAIPIVNENDTVAVQVGV